MKNNTLGQEEQINQRSTLIISIAQASLPEGFEINTQGDRNNRGLVAYTQEGQFQLQLRNGQNLSRIMSFEWNDSEGQIRDQIRRAIRVMS
ncbi:MAG: hypothetical protein HRT90_04795 [Candidatus Margulisbacteria bacterium]|nr:hypothetical protein [Candidatus Margulisiibacteriota bacterium]